MSKNSSGLYEINVGPSQESKENRYKKDKSTPFMWVWDVQVNEATGYLTVFLEEIPKDWTKLDPVKLAVEAYSKEEIIDKIHSFGITNPFMQVNLEGKLARENDEIMKEINEEYLNIAKTGSIKQNTGLINGDSINPKFERKIARVAINKALLKAYALTAGTDIYKVREQF